MAAPFVLGADLSSATLAFVCRHPAKAKYKIGRYDLGKPYRPESCAKALHHTMEFLAELDGFIPHRVDRLAYVEAPVVGRGGSKPTMVQSFVSGVVQACLVNAGFKVYLVNNMTWKKTVCGNGRSSKEDIARVVGHRLPELFDRIKYSQDLTDAAGLCIYGSAIAASRRRMAGTG